MAKAITLPQAKGAASRSLADTAGRLAELANAVTGAIEERQPRLTGTPGQVVGFNEAGEAQVLTLQAGENVSIKQKDGVVTISAAESGGSSLTLKSICIQTPPTKTTYLQGDLFDPGGMVVMGKFTMKGVDILDAEVTGYTYSTAPLADGTTSVTISYSEGGVTCTADVEITVIHRMTAINVKEPPSKSTYEYGDALDTAGMVVEAVYSDDAVETVDGWIVQHSVLSSVGTQEITVSYGDLTATFDVTVERKTISKYPAQKGALTYNGEPQSPEWDNCDSAQIILGGVLTGTNAGSYNASATPRDNYRWQDGTTESKALAWTIGRAVPKAPVPSTTSIILDASTRTASFTVDRDGDGEITAASSDTSIATVSVSGTTVTISSVDDKMGTVTITVKVAEGSNYLASKDVTITVDAKFLPEKKALNDTSWADIRAIADAGLASSYWAVGDTKTITINGRAVNYSFYDLTIAVFILGFDHNSDKEGTNRIDFMIGKYGKEGAAFCDGHYDKIDFHVERFQMNGHYNNNGGGWRDSYMRNTILGSSSDPTSPLSDSFIAALPADLREVMKPVTKYTDNTGGGSNTASYVTATADWLFLLAEFEVFGNRYGANSAEQKYQLQYQYYKNGNSRIAYEYASNMDVWWWLRSPHCGSSQHYCCVSTSGGYYSNTAACSGGLRPCFSV